MTAFSATLPPGSGTAVRNGDTVARYSSDEFVILLPDIQNPLEAEEVTARVRTSLTEPVEVEGRKVFVDVAIGTSVSDGLPGEGTGTQSESARLLLEKADFEMYQSKARARGQRPPGAQRKDYLRLETDLRGAAVRPTAGAVPAPNRRGNTRNRRR